MGEACCGMAAEGHGCGCVSEFENESVVQEPDWIPDGDGRAIGIVTIKGLVEEIVGDLAAW